MYSRNNWLANLVLLFSIAVLAACGGGGGGGGGGDDEVSDLDPPVPAPPEGLEVIPFNDAGAGQVIYDLSGDLDERFGIVRGTRLIYAVDSGVQLQDTQITEDFQVTLDGQVFGEVYLANQEVFGGVSAAAVEKEPLPSPSVSTNGKQAVLAWQDGGVLKFLDVREDGQILQTQQALPGEPIAPIDGPALPSDGNNSPASATPISQDNATGAQVSSVSDPNDYYSFTPSRSITVDFILDFAAGDLDLIVYDASLSTLGESRSSENLGERVLLDLVAGQTYIVRVMAYDTGGANIDYTLTASEVVVLDPDNNGSIALAQPIFQGGETQTQDASNPTDRLDYFSFTATATAPHGFTLSMTGDSDLSLALLDSSGLPLASSNSPVGVTERIQDQNLIQGQQYYLRVEATTPGAASYRLTRSISAPPIDNNNNFAEAQSIADSGDIFSSGVNDDGDINDYYVFTASQAGHIYTVQLAFGGGNLDLYLYEGREDPLQPLLRESSVTGAQPEEVERELVQGVTYYVRVAASSTDGAQTYRLSISSTPVVVDDGNNSFEDADPLALGAVAAESVNSSDDPIDFYRFSASDACRTTTLALTAEADALRMTLFDQDEQFIVQDTPTISRQLPANTAGGSYYVQIGYVMGGGVTGEVPYSLTRTSTAISDGNDSPLQAVTLIDGGNAMVGGCDSEDWYTWSVLETVDYQACIETSGDAVTAQYYVDGGITPFATVGSGSCGILNGLAAGQTVLMRVTPEGAETGYTVRIPTIILPPDD